ncbi:MAG: secondary thiamine-phosphate synthase enzyme YjbQ [Pseudomonadota bacterium]
MEKIQIKTGTRIEFVDITSRVRDAIGKSGVRDGIAVVHVSHTTAGITINEAADPAVVADINTKLSQMVPLRDSYRHMEGNSDAHIKAALVGSSVSLVVSGGAPVLGTWQGIFFCEFDGPRNRSAVVQVVPA